MGNSLDKETMQIMLEELASIQKEASPSLAFRGARMAMGLGNLLSRGGSRVSQGAKGAWEAVKAQPKALQEGAKRLIHPWEGLKKGFKELAPANAIRSGTQKSKGFMTGGRVPLGNIASAPNVPVMSKARYMAEELGRRGWTGGGRMTKYMPVGAKTMQLGFMGMSAPEIAAASKRDPSATGQGGLGEAIGSHGLGNLAFLSSGRLGMPAAMAMYLAASKVGGGAGRIVDRLRGGANLGTAISAPSPEEAQAQLQNIQRHYG